MILTINGIVVDATKELEMFRPELGYNCFIKLNDGRDDDYRYNCTEFHHLYNMKYASSRGLSSAFESDIHGTGGTLDIRDIDSITIVDALKIHTEYGVE